MAVEQETTTIEQQIETVKGQVDIALNTRFFKNPIFPSYRRFGPAMSTTRDTVNTDIISSDELLRWCGPFTMELADNLSDTGIDFVVAYGSEKGDNAIGHMFIQLLNGIIVDTTIGQFLPDHPHVFVGTRDMLLALLREHFPNEKLTQRIRERWGKDLRTADEVYQAIWGTQSLVVDSDLVYVRDKTVAERLTADSPVLV